MNSWTDVFRGRFGAYTLLLNIGVLFFAVDNFLINTLMPSIVADIGGVAFYAWAMMLYLVGSIMGAASYGRCGRASAGAGPLRLAAPCSRSARLVVRSPRSWGNCSSHGSFRASAAA